MVRVRRVADEGVSYCINEAVDVLREGGIVIYPTDTVYGIAADAENREAVIRVYEVKRRPRWKPLTIAVSGMRMLRNYSRVDPLIEELISGFLPGPVTFILPKSDRVIPEVNPKAIGIRIPDSLISREIARRLGRAITSTSANISSMPPPSTCSEAIRQVEADLAIDVGLLPRRRPSTIIDLTVKPPALIREGPLDFQKFISRYREVVGWP
mgnify:CR=1 FL=1